MQSLFHLPKLHFKANDSQWMCGANAFTSWAALLEHLEALAKEGAQLNRSADAVEVDLTSAYGPLSLSIVLDEPVRFVSRCESTQALLKTHVQACSIVVADEQTAGRGRLGRQWSSEPGKNILMSMAMKPDGPVMDWAKGPLLWAAVIADSLGMHVKWPNDIVTANGEKLGGILSSLEIDSDGTPYLIFGLGLNVHQSSFPELPQATALSLVYQQSPSRLGILAHIVKAIRRVHLSDSLDLWRNRCLMLGTVVRVAGIEGVAESIREDGALVVDGQAILSGDVEIIEGLKP